MSKSAANLFRIRQAVADLRAYARLSGRAVRTRMATGVGGGFDTVGTLAAIDRLVDQQGGRFKLPDDARLYDACVLAAALPHEDYPAFTFATALLLLDRLQKGDGHDDLYWNWDSFAAEYALADPAVRSALINGFRMGDAADLVSIAAAPDSTDCLTRSQDTVLAMSEASGVSPSFGLLDPSLSAEAAGQAWADAQLRPLFPAETMAFRYLYERPLSMTPPAPGQVPLIPWIAD